MIHYGPNEQFRDLTPDKLESLNDGELTSAIVDHVHLALGNEYDKWVEIIRRLPASVRAIYATWNVDAEVNNGGFNQYFWNLESTGAVQYMPFASIQGYELLGAADYTSIMWGALATWQQETEQMAVFREANTLESFIESYKHTTLDELDKRYFGLDDRILDLQSQYIRKHTESFVSRAVKPIVDS